jgi:hypothetical protein
VGCKECLHNNRDHFQDLLWSGCVPFMTYWSVTYERTQCKMMHVACVPLTGRIFKKLSDHFLVHDSMNNMKQLEMTDKYHGQARKLHHSLTVWITCVLKFTWLFLSNIFKRNMNTLV